MNAVLLFTASLLLLGASSYAGPCGCSSQKKLPARIGDECDITYYKRIFPIDVSCGCKEKLKTFYDSVFCKYEGETEETYVTRIDTIFDQIHQNIDCRTNTLYVDYLENYYIYKYGKRNRENDEVFFERVLKKSSESASEYISKAELIKRFVKSVDWSKVSFDENTSTGYSIIKKSSNKKKDEKIEAKKREHERNVEEIESRKRTHARNVETIEAKKREHEENVKKWVKAHYKRESGESIDNYYSRICSRDSISDEEYITRLTIARSLFRDLELWYSEKYLSEIEYYYKKVFSKKSTETDLEYYNRLLSKEAYESEENFLNRLTLLQKIFVGLPLWYDERFYETYTFKFYQYCYEQGENEHDEEYLNRVFTKFCGESEEDFWKRVKLIKKTFPNYPCWYNKENLKRLDFCTSLYEAENIEDLTSRIYSDNISDECREIQIECLKTFFESSDSSYSCS